MKTKSRSCLFLAACLTMPMLGSSAFAGTFTFGSFTGDADSGVNPAASYTAKVDFAGDGSRVVNGVTFNETTQSGTNYALTGAPNGFGNYNNNVGGGANGLIRDFNFTGDGSGNASMTVSGLTPGQQYQSTWYNAAFGGPGGRVVDITPSDTGSTYRFDQNYSGAGNGNLLRYNFTAAAPTQSYTFDAVNNGDSFHHYAFTNGAAADLPFPIIATASNFAPGSPFTPSNTDLLQTSVALFGVSSAGDFTRETAGGVPVLNDGIFQINGGFNNNGQLATGIDNSFVQYDLDTSINIRGYDISSVVGYGGWNDGGRDRQLYDVFYSLVGDPAFALLGSVNADGPGGNGSAVMATFNTNLTGVDAIRFNFLGGQENGHAGYGEFDVIGFATIPEPGRASLALFGILALVSRRRRSR